MASSAASPAAWTGWLTARNVHGRPYLFSPFLDLMMSGGLAIIVFSLLFIFFPAGTPSYGQQKIYVLTVMGWVAFIVNDPHFMASYQLLYHRYFEKLKRFRTNGALWRRYIIAGMIVPSGLAAYLAYALAIHSGTMLAYATQAMMIIVVWHYTKQAFGVFMMLSAMKKIFYTPRQRLLLLLNSYIVWVCFTIGTLGSGSGTQLVNLLPGYDSSHGQYFTLTGPENEILGGVFLVAALTAVLIILWEKKRPSLTAVVAYLSMYYMIFGATFHPLWVAFYPAFHSLQYLMFVYSYKRGEMQAAIAATEDAAEIQHLKRLKNAFLMKSVVLGYLSFWAVPGALEAWLNPTGASALPVTLAFILFINIHHYFIDNVIWRKEHSEIAKYVFYPPMQSY